jgi:hypothetical protein
MALVTLSRAFQGFLVWQVTMNTFCPGLGWPNRAVYRSIMSHWPLVAGSIRPS